MDTNCLSSKAFRSAMQKAVTLRARRGKFCPVIPGNRDPRGGLTAHARPLHFSAGSLPRIW